MLIFIFFFLDTIHAAISFLEMTRKYDSTY
jgi:hypothetical protein